MPHRSVSQALDKVGGRSLRSGFLTSAAAKPYSPALFVDGMIYRYCDLEQAARRWAQGIVQTVEGPPMRVGVFAYRSHVSYAGVLAALFAGAAFVPLNRKFPIERTRTMVRMAELDAIIVDEGSAAQLEGVLEGLESPPLILLPQAAASSSLRGPGKRLTGEELDKLSPLDVLPEVLPDEIVYLLFTSGSTGQPKGVPVAHRNVLHFIDVMIERYGITAADRFSQTFDQTFDLSIFDLFVAWERGACVFVLQPMDLLSPGRFINKHGITVWFSVPSIPALMRKTKLLKPATLPTLRWSLFCGEPLARASAEAWQQAAPNSVVENLYGPTELTIACLVHRWDPVRSPAMCINDMVPIGRPYPGLGALVVDESLRPVPPNESGELCICGPQKVPGYWRNPEKTSAAFVSICDPSSIDIQFYRTGDRVSRLPAGEYVYLGRVDHQVKVLGHRVELGEIEGALMRDPRVVQAVALGWPVEEGVAQGIIAFVSGNGVIEEQLRDGVRQLVPDYMTPREIRILNEFPLNPNGKVDRKALMRQLEEEHASSTASSQASPNGISLSGTDLASVVRRHFQLPADASVRDAAMNAMPGWDSLAHVGLLLAVEEALGITITSDDLERTRTFVGLQQLCLEKTACAAATEWREPNSTVPVFQ